MYLENGQLSSNTLHQNEEWKNIKGYEGRYQISNFGRVWSFVSNKFLSPSRNAHGYMNVVLIEDSGIRYTHSVHRLVAEAFIFNPYRNLHVHVHHKDSFKINNHVNNLEWITESTHAWVTYESKVNELIRKYGNTPVVQCDRTTSGLIRVWRKIDIYIGFNGKVFVYQSVHACCGNLIQSHGGYQWFYIHDYRRLYPNIEIKL